MIRLFVTYESSTSSQPTNLQSKQMNEVENCLGGKHRPGMTINFLKKEFLKLPSVVQGIQRNKKKLNTIVYIIDSFIIFNRNTDGQ